MCWYDDDAAEHCPLRGEVPRQGRAHLRAIPMALHTMWTVSISDIQSWLEQIGQGRWNQTSQGSEAGWKGRVTKKRSRNDARVHVRVAWLWGAERSGSGVSEVRLLV